VETDLNIRDYCCTQGSFEKASLSTMMSGSLLSWDCSFKSKFRLYSELALDWLLDRSLRCLIVRYANFRTNTLHRTNLFSLPHGRNPFLNQIK
jgi:hypothetical protein